MKKISVALMLLVFSISCNAQPQGRAKSNEPKGYQIGDKAEDFELKNVDGKMQSLAGFENAKGYIVVFTSNECPFSKGYEDRLIQLHNEMSPKGYPVVAINPNDGSEGGGDTYQDMIKRHQDKKFPFVYLQDEKQDVYPRFGATKTPHVFLLDNEMIVRYIGSIDDSPRSPEDVKERYVVQAIEALEAGKSPEPAVTKAIGCGIKSKSENGGGHRAGGGPGRQGPPSPEKILEMMDKDNDQQVSKSEAHGPLAQHFDKLDENGDGLLTKEELSNIKKPE